MKLSGSLDSKGLPVVPIRIQGPYGRRELRAYVDTCFGGNISIPREVKFSLGLPSVGKISLIDARGGLAPASTAECEVEWDGHWRDAEVVVGSPGSVPLIGARLLHGRKLTVDYGPARSVEIE
jgi:predicted aspartyl protease